MTTMPFDALACPLDGCPLAPSEKTWRCENGHSFDVARQGYVHLLPVQKKRSLDPGDSKEMVAARQRFLNAGFYTKIAEAVSNQVLQWLLPILPESLDLVLCLFGFPVYSEFARVLKTGGKVMQVDAGADHLRELREIIYPELKPPADTEMVDPEGFRTLDSTVLRFPLSLPDQDSIADLLAMTPHLYRANSEGLEKAASLESLVVTVDVVLKCLERR